MVKNKKGGGENSYSRQKVLNLIKHIVENEDKSHPLSDEEISKKLKENGYKVARRTVAKYRKILGILPANKRN